MAKEPANTYTPTRGNDAGAEVVQIVLEWFRGKNNVSFTSGEVTNITTAIQNILNRTSRI